MSDYVKLVVKNRRNYMRKMRDLCLSLIFAVFVACAFLFMFSYGDNYSIQHKLKPPQYTSRKYRIGYSTDDFAVKNYTWRCENNSCIRYIQRNDEEPISLTSCGMLCGASPPLWPKPRLIDIKNKSYSTLSLESVSFEITTDGYVKRLLNDAANIFMKNLEAIIVTTPSTSNPTIKLNIKLKVQDGELARFVLTTDEQYELSVVKKDDGVVIASISAANFFGARHGLETLSQLIWFDEFTKELKILHNVDISDRPAFSYRGLMVDTARNFFPIPKLMRVIDGMAASKLNILHLHLTDYVSFPIVLPSVPELAEFGAYNPDMVYKTRDIKELIQYGRIRGVKIILEVDAPSHVNAGWNFAQELYGENYVMCGDRDIFQGLLNPDNENVLQVLEDIYTDLLELTEADDVFHIGSDEVDLTCWEKSQTMKKYKKNAKKMWMDYTNRMIERLQNANYGKLPKNIIMWSSKLTNDVEFENLTGNITVQSWLGSPARVLGTGHSVIYSTVGFWYLDCGFGPWNEKMSSGVCDPYTPWQKFYEYRPWVKYHYQNQTLGGEVCLWTEQVDIDDLETRIWPRTSAFAERVWSDPVAHSPMDVYDRLVRHKELLRLRGVQTAGLWPRWCSQNPGKCGFRR